MKSECDLGLYVHIPFCSAKCGYCDFNSHAGREGLIPAYTQALLKEARMWSAVSESLASGDWQVDTLFFGGGTPSLMPLPQMERLLPALREHFRLAPTSSPGRAEPEVTLEANPGTVDERYLSRLRELGVNRLSLGVQSFRDDELAFLGRIHTSEEAREAYRAARSAGFDNVSLDLIFGLPCQTLQQWLESLNEAIALGPEHLSLYALTVAEGTPLARDVADGRTPAPDPDLQAELYERSAERLKAAGYEQYEISNWARTGHRCRHNLTYWNNGSWLGLGAGAHSHLPSPDGGGMRLANADDPARYIELVDESLASLRGAACSSIDDLRQATVREEAGPSVELSDTLVLGLRLCEGVSVSELRRRFGQAALGAHAAAFDEATSQGLLERVDGRLRLTARGRLLANEVFVRLLPPS